MKNQFLQISVLGLLLSFSLFSCKKSAENSQQSTEAAENNAFAEAQFNDLTTLIDQAAINSTVNFDVNGIRDGQISQMGSSCITLSIDTTSNPKKITVDFGTSNCYCLDGRNRRGKVIATYTGKYRESGTIVNFTLENYYVDDNKIEGTKTITNQGLNQTGNRVYKIVVNGAITKANNGGTFTWASTRYREWKAGAATALNILDDVYGITGNASGTTVEGKEYTISITQELVRKMNCKWFESGVLDLTLTGSPKITLDYGSTGCDNAAVVKILGIEYPIQLK